VIERVYAIAINTYREAVRDRVLYGVLACAIAVLLFTLAIAELSLDQQERVVLDVGLASISLFSVAVAVFLGSSLLYKEIERKTLYVILPKPIRRWEFLVGKYVGIVLTAFVFIAIMGAIQLWVATNQARAPAWTIFAVLGGAIAALGIGLRLARPSGPLGAWSIAVLPVWAIAALVACGIVASSHGVSVSIIAASLTLTCGEVMVLAAVALFFSSFSTPFLTGLLSLGIWLAGRSADAMITMPERTIGPELKALLGAAAEVLPNFNLFVPGHHTLALEHGANWGYVGQSMGYGLAYAAILLGLASLVFRKRDLL
jgi:ABC-type transport system involved in multi-copper enzyme maturation permease subunit